jgi:hypothetical protein
MTSRPQDEGERESATNQGDDLADRLGGGEGRAMPMTPGQAASGQASPFRTEGSAAEPVAIDPGSPGGMGGAGGNARHDRPPGGVSPIEADEEAGAERH